MKDLLLSMPKDKLVEVVILSIAIPAFAYAFVDFRKSMAERDAFEATLARFDSSGVAIRQEGPVLKSLSELFLRSANRLELLKKVETKPDSPPLSDQDWARWQSDILTMRSQERGDLGLLDRVSGGAYKLAGGLAESLKKQLTAEDKCWVSLESFLTERHRKGSPDREEQLFRDYYSSLLEVKQSYASYQGSLFGAIDQAERQFGENGANYTEARAKIRTINREIDEDSWIMAASLSVSVAMVALFIAPSFLNKRKEPS
jgi:hypothetical protein